MPAPGTPVASTITSMRGSAITAAASSVTHVPARFMRVVERCSRVAVVLPAGGLELAARPADIEIDDGGEMHAARARDLRQKHRAELAGADQCDRDRPAGGLALEQFGMKVHARDFTGTSPC